MVVFVVCLFVYWFKATDIYEDAEVLYFLF